MAKKKVGSEELVVDSNQLPVVSDQAVEDVGYDIGVWKGFTQYRCKHCAFDTLKLKAIQDHVDKRHKEPALTPPLAPPHLITNGEGDKEEVFEVELKEVDSTVDEDGNEVKKFTIKEN